MDAVEDTGSGYIVAAAARWAAGLGSGLGSGSEAAAHPCVSPAGGGVAFMQAKASALSTALRVVSFSR